MWVVCRKDKDNFPFIIDINGCGSYLRDKGVIWALKGGPMRDHMFFGLRVGFWNIR